MFCLPSQLPRQLQQQHVLLGPQIQQAPVVLNFPWSLAGLQLSLTLQESLPKDRVKRFFFFRLFFKGHELGLLHQSEFSLLIPFPKCPACAGRKQLLAFLLACYIFFFPPASGKEASIFN